MSGLLVQLGGIAAAVVLCTWGVTVLLPPPSPAEEDDGEAAPSLGERGRGLELVYSKPDPPYDWNSPADNWAAW